MKMSKIKNSDSDFERLRLLLVGEEIERLDELDNRLKDDLFNDKVSKAISKEIANNRDSMIDTLYPIIGEMISKYVTQAIKEMIENINSKIENSLSFDKYKRVIKSKITGVSQMELLLEESNIAIISSLFIIKKDSGLLIAKSQLDNKDINDPHMVASMASAIRDFINDWIENHQSKSEVQILSYGNATLYIESAGSVYIIAFLNSEPDYKLRKSINIFFASIVKEYSSFFQSFAGDDSALEIEALSSKMYNYLNKQTNLSNLTNTNKNYNFKKKKNPIKYLLYIALFLATIYITYNLNIRYFEYRLESIIKDKTNQKIIVTLKDDTLILEGHIDRLDNLYEIEEIVKTQTTKPFKNKLIVPIENIIEVVQSKDDKISSINKENRLSIDNLNQKVVFLNRALKKSQEQILQLTKTKQDIEIFKRVDIKKEILSKLDEAFKDNKFYIKYEKSLDFRDLHIFGVGKSKYNLDTINIVGQTFEKYITILAEYMEYIESITIEGHTDSAGDEDKNIALSQKRAKEVREYLSNLPIVENSFMKYLLEIDGVGSKESIKVDGVEDKNASRRIKIKLKLKDNI